MKSTLSRETKEIMKIISNDRVRTNLLKNPEQKILAFLVQHVPSWISSNMLTALGLFGSIMVFSGFILAINNHKNYLLLSVLGFIIGWFGDSLDGRIAYFRNKPRKLYGFILDITIDWIGIIIIGCGYIIYSDGIWALLGYGFVVMYGWEMIIALMRYKITGRYSIDSGKLGPTEARIIISAILVAEVLQPGSIHYSALFVSIILFFVNVIDTRKLLYIADSMDMKEARKKTKGEDA